MAVATGKIFASAFQGRTFISPLIDLLIKNGRNGNVVLNFQVYVLELEAVYFVYPI